MCEWCGHEHAVTELCTKRPKWGRRGFLLLGAAALVGMAVKDLLPSLPAPSVSSAWMRMEPPFAGSWEAFTLDFRVLLAPGVGMKQFVEQFQKQGLLGDGPVPEVRGVDVDQETGVIRAEWRPAGGPSGRP